MEPQWPEASVNAHQNVRHVLDFAICQVRTDMRLPF